jgi:antitoxin YefM
VAALCSGDGAAVGAVGLKDLVLRLETSVYPRLNMLTGSKHAAVVGKNGKIEIHDTQLPEGAQVEVIVLLENTNAEERAIAYPPELLEAVDRVERRQGLVTFTAEEWNVKDNV